MLYAFFFSQLALLSFIGTNIAASKSLCLEYVESQIVEVSRCFVIVVDTVSVAFFAVIPVFSGNGRTNVHRKLDTHSFLCGSVIMPRIFFKAETDEAM